MPTTELTSILAAVTQALPGPDDPVDGLEAPRLGQPERERADRLGATGDDQRADPEQAGGPGDDRVDGAVRAGGRRDDDLVDAGDAAPGRRSSRG